MRGLLDLVQDLLLDLAARRTRAVLMLTAVALSTGALIMSVGLTATAARQIDADIAASGTDTFSVVAADVTEAGDATSRVGPIFPASSGARIEALDLVQAAGLRMPVDSRSMQRTQTGEPLTDPPAIVGATRGYLRAVGADLPAGWVLDDTSGVRAVLVGQIAADYLGIPAGTVDFTGYRIYLDRQPYEVVGVLPAGAHAALASSVVLPYAQAFAAVGHDENAEVLVRTEPGAGAPVARVARETIRPDVPGLLTVSTVVDPRAMRTGVNDQLARYSGSVGLLLLALTGLLIANSMVVSVVARTAEIGLRRALGASRAAIGTLFLADGALLGVMGGLMGSALGCVAIVVTAAVNDWSTSLAGWYPLVGPAIGAVVGLVGSVYPSLRAASVSPAEAVRVE